MPWFSHLYDHGHGYIRLPWLDLARARAWFLVGELLALYMWPAYWLKYANKRPLWLPDVQRKNVPTMESYQDCITRIPWSARSFWPDTYARDDLKALLLAHNDSQHMRVLKKLRYISAFQIWHPKSSWTICSTAYTWPAMVVNPHWLYIWASRRWRTYDGDDMCLQI